MPWVAVNCPQCAAPLPRVAIWRAVKCGSCGSLITKTESIVTRESFRRALARSREGGGDIQCAGERYLLLELLGTGEISQVYRARRIGALSCLVTLKLSSDPAAAARYAREAEVVREMHALSPLLCGLSGVLAQGSLEGDASRQALVLPHPNGFWGSLADLSGRFPGGIDPRHAVWVWRRLLDVLRIIHAQGWVHGDVRPEHALVHPQDHAVRMISWGSARKDTRDLAKDQAADLLRCARTIVVLVSGAAGSGAVPDAVPPVLATLLMRASQDEAFCRRQGAQGLDDLLRAAAQEAFGPPSFVTLNI